MAAGQQFILALIITGIALTYEVLAEKTYEGWTYRIPWTEKVDIEYILYPGGSSWEDALATCKTFGTLLCSSFDEELRILIDNSPANFSAFWVGSKNCGGPEEKCLFYDWKSRNYITYCERRPNFICKRYVSVLRTIYCPQTFNTDLEWPSTVGNTSKRLQCPIGSIGEITWFCDGKTGQWNPETPSIEDCVSNHLNWDLFIKNISNSNLVESSQKLIQMVYQAQFSGDILKTLMAIGEILDRSKYVSVEENQRDFPLACEDIITSCDILIENKKPWLQMNEFVRFGKMEDLFSAVEESGFILLKHINSTKLIIQRKNIVLEVLKDQPELRLTFPDAKNCNKTLARIVLPPLIVDSPEDNRAVFTWYNGVAPMLPNESQLFQHRILNSPLVGASILKSAELDLSEEPVQIFLEHIVPGASNPLCVFWSEYWSTWSSEGCHVESSNESHTLCKCNHLTNFAVLMDIKCTTCNLSHTHKSALTIISIAGCVTSSFFLLLGIIILSHFRTLQNVKNTIHKNLSIMLLTGNVLILGGLDRTENMICCGIIAGALHYVFLSAFFWMLLEAFHIQLLLTKVFQPKHNYIKRYYAVGYGFPALIVISTVALRHEDYGNSDFCWLSKENGTVWSFVGPAVVIFFYNTVTLGMALWISHHCCPGKVDEQIEAAKIWTRRAVVLLPVLGVTWSVGFLYIDESYVGCAYLFVVLNSLQGLGLFVFHVALRVEVREAISRWLRVRRLVAQKSLHSGSNTSSHQ